MTHGGNKPMNNTKKTEQNKAVRLIAATDRIARIALKKAIDAETKVDQIVIGKMVYGMDIYIQATEPAVSGDFVWINTTGINNIIK